MAKKSKLLFSVNTVLACRISTTYYNNEHYVWCCDKYSYGPEQPASSNPMLIAQRYLQDVYSKDLHSAIIQQNKRGIILGAAEKRKSGIITRDQEADIVATVEAVSLDEFLPLLYVIPFNTAISKVCIEVPRGKKAAPHSCEYIIPSLKRHQFEIVDLSKTVPEMVRGSMSYE